MAADYKKLAENYRQEEERIRKKLERLYLQRRTVRDPKLGKRISLLEDMYMEMRTMAREMERRAEDREKPEKGR